MARVRPLSNAPIQEALIDLLIEGSLPSKDDLQAISNAVTAENWLKEQIDTFEAEFGSDGPAGDFQFKAKAKQFEGYSVSSPKRDRVFQIRANRITASHVRSYASWERLEEDASWLLAEFVKLAPEVRIKRMAARFINRLRLPVGFEHRWSDLLIRPPLPPEGVAPLGTPIFLSRQVLGLEGGLTANVAVGTALPSEGEDFPSLVVDVDVYKLCDESATFNDIRGQLAEIREVKNSLFFGSLQEFALEPYI